LGLGQELVIVFRPSSLLDDVRGRRRNLFHRALPRAFVGAPAQEPGPMAEPVAAHVTEVSDFSLRAPIEHVGGEGRCSVSASVSALVKTSILGRAARRRIRLKCGVYACLEAQISGPDRDSLGRTAGNPFCEGPRRDLSCANISLAKPCMRLEFRPQGRWRRSQPAKPFSATASCLRPYSPASHRVTSASGPSNISPRAATGKPLIASPAT
jgi:hypothetical protein